MRDINRDKASAYSVNIGNVYGRLTVIDIIEPYENQDNIRYAICQCSCNAHTIKRVRCYYLASHKTLSCGCIRRELAKKHAKTLSFIDGRVHERLYDIYTGMLQRCFNKNANCYNAYGGRGITVCSRWLEPDGKGYANFKHDSYATGYHDPLSTDKVEDYLTIDRIRVNGNYEPSNIRWITKREQARNRRTPHIIEIHGKTYTIEEAAELCKIKRAWIDRRYAKGWTNNAISTWLEMMLDNPDNILYKRRSGYRDKNGFLVLIKDRPAIRLDPRYDPDLVLGAAAVRAKAKLEYEKAWEEFYREWGG